MQNETPRKQATLSRVLAGAAQDSDHAGTAAAVWRGIANVLSPIIGTRGVIALFRRSLFVCSTEYVWLATAYDTAKEWDNFELLREVFAVQSRTVALAGNSALLRTFYDLLSHLIGDSLTDRLLEAVPLPISDGSAVQDTSP